MTLIFLLFLWTFKKYAPTQKKLHVRYRQAIKISACAFTSDVVIVAGKKKT